MLKLGIIGTGGICNNKHLPSLAKVHMLVPQKAELLLVRPS